MASPPSARSWDYLPVAAGAAATGAAVGYVRLMRDQGDEPVAWFLGALIVAAALAFFRSIRAAAHRAQVLVVSGSRLIALGVLGMFSIGLPILLAGVIGLVAARRVDQPSRSRS